MIPLTFKSPSIVVSVLTLKPFAGDIDALTLPLTILSNSKFVIPDNGMLYNCDASPLNEPVNDPVVYDDVNKLKSFLLFNVVIATEPLKSLTDDEIDEDISVLKSPKPVVFEITICEEPDTNGVVCETIVPVVNNEPVI